MSMEVPRPQDLVSQTPLPIEASPLNRWQRREIDRATALALMRERARFLMTQMQMRGYDHLEDLALSLGLDRSDRLEAEYRKSENPMRRLVIEQSMERWMRQIETILRNHNA